MRVGDVFLKIDGDQHNTDIEVAAMELAPVPTPQVLWRRPPVLALAALRGSHLGHFGEPSTATARAWSAAGSAIRALHSAPLPPWTGRSHDEFALQLDEECSWLADNRILPPDLIAGNRHLAEAVLRPCTPVFVHGDLQPDHIFVDTDEVSGVIDWSEASQGDACYDLAVLTLGHPEHLSDVLEGYGGGVDPDVVRAWWSMRGLLAIRWLVDHGFDPFAPGTEVDVLKAQLKSKL